MKIAFISALTIAVLVSVSGTGHAQNKKFEVGVSMPEAQNPFYIALGNSVSATFKARDIHVRLVSANADVNAQIDGVSDLIAAHVDAILLSPVDAEGSAAAVEHAHSENIPVFMVARNLSPRFGQLWKAFINVPFDEVGAAKGQWLKNNVKPGNIAMLLGPAGALVMVEQEKAFRSIVEPAGFKVVFAQNSPQTRENGLKLAEDALVAHPDLVAIYASNDDVALGAVQAVKAAGKIKDVAVLGVNATPPALASIERSELAATVFIDPVGLGQAAANTVADFLQKKTEPERIVTFHSKIVDRTNAAELMR